MKIISLICLLFLLKPLTTNATEFSRWLPSDVYPTNNSLDYINDKLFEGVCTIDTSVGHPFCLDSLERSTEPEINITLAFQNDHKALNQNTSNSNLRKVIIPKNYEYRHQYHRNDSVAGGLKLPLFRSY